MWNWPKVLLSLWVVMLMLSHGIHAQESIVDSLESALRVTTDHTESRNIKSQLSKEWLNSNPKTSLKFAAEALAADRKSNNSLNLAQSHYNVGAAYFRLGHPDSALTYADSSVSLFTEVKDSMAIIKSVVLVAASYRGKGDYHESIKQNLDAMAIAKSLNDSNYKAAIANNLGNLFMDLSDYENAISYYQEAKGIYEATGTKRNLPVVYHNIGYSYTGLGQFDSAIYYIQTSISLYESESQLSLPYFTLGNAYAFKGELDSAIRYTELSLDVSTKFENLRNQVLAKNLRGNVLNLMGDFAMAKQTLQESYELAKSAGISAQVITCLEHMSEVEINLGNHQRGHELLTECLILKDSIFNEELGQQVAFYQEKYRADERELEIARLARSEAEKLVTISEQKYRSTLVLVAFGVVLIIGFAILLFYLKSRRSNLDLARKNQIIQEKNQQLKDQNEQLEDINREKDGLIQIVAHDLKTPFSNARGLLDLIQLNKPDSDQSVQAIALIRQVCDNSIKMIQDLLDVSHLEEMSTRLEWTNFNIIDVIRDSVESFKPRAKDKDIVLVCENSSGKLMINSDPHAVSRILNNLLSNAIKFSPSGSSVTIAQVQQDQELLLIVEDEGPGLSKEDQTNLFKKFKKLGPRPTAGESSHGLGLSIVKTLMDRLEGTIEVESEIGKGSKFILNFPLS